MGGADGVLLALLTYKASWMLEGYTMKHPRVGENPILRILFPLDCVVTLVARAHRLLFLELLLKLFLVKDLNFFLFFTILNLEKSTDSIQGLSHA
jgi:hypothetical protein